MRKHMYIVLGLFVVALIIPTIVFSDGINEPFGGQVTATPLDLSSLATCDGGYGPFTINSFTSDAEKFGGATMYYFISARVRTGTPETGDYILGYASTTNVTSCQTTATPSVPFPVQDITAYGTSGFDLMHIGI